MGVCTTQVETGRRPVSDPAPNGRQLPPRRNTPHRGVSTNRAGLVDGRRLSGNMEGVLRISLSGPGDRGLSVPGTLRVRKVRTP